MIFIYKNGMEYKRVCRICGKELVYGSFSAYSLAEKNNAVCRNCATRMSAKRKCDITPLLEETPLAYYWVGFLLADGSFVDGRIKFHLKQEDFEQVKKFADFIKWTGEYDDRGELGKGVSAKHVEVVNKLIEKFDIKRLKTYNPPDTLLCHDRELLKFLIGGFIDGDGNISKQTGRNDCFIRIKLHSSWESILKEFCRIINYDESHVRLNNNGYAELIISDSNVISDLKRKLVSGKVPLLERKWSKIDDNFVSRKNKAKETREKVIKMLCEGMRKCDISRKLSISSSLVTKISKSYER